MRRRSSAVCSIEEGSQGRSRIVVTELPYQVNKARLAEKIAELVKAGRVKDIADVHVGFARWTAS